MRIPVFLDKPRRRSIKEVLEDRTGAGIAEGLGAVGIIMVLTMTISISVVTYMDTIQALAVKAERQALVSSLVGDKREGVLWGPSDAPSTETMPLESGRDVDVTMWRESSPVGVTLTAVTAISAGEDAADCTAPSDIEKRGCIYASRFHAGALDDIEPQAIIRMDPSTADTGPTGTVDSRVATGASIPQGTVFATGADTEATVWRYLVTAKALEGNGGIRFTQAGKTLATFPVDSGNSNYFGTFSATINVPVTATVTHGNVVVETVYVYRAGGTS